MNASSEAEERSNCARGFLLPLILATVACAAGPPPEPPMADYRAEQRGSLSGALDDIWAAALGVAESSNATVLTSDKRLGLLALRYDTGPRITRSDIRNVRSLLEKVESQTDPVSDYVYDHLSDVTRAELATLGTMEYPSDAIIAYFINDLNHMIYNELLYEQEPFVSMTPDTNMNVYTENGPILNRLLLNESFPNEIIPSAALQEPRYRNILYADIYIRQAVVNGSPDVMVTSWVEGSPTISGFNHEFLDAMNTMLRAGRAETATTSALYYKRKNDFPKATLSGTTAFNTSIFRGIKSSVIWDAVIVIALQRGPIIHINTKDGLLIVPPYAIHVMFADDVATVSVDVREQPYEHTIWSDNIDVAWSSADRRRLVETFLYQVSTQVDAGKRWHYLQ